MILHQLHQRITRLETGMPDSPSSALSDTPPEQYDFIFDVLILATREITEKRLFLAESDHFIGSSVRLHRVDATAHLHLLHEDPPTLIIKGIHRPSNTQYIIDIEAEPGSIFSSHITVRFPEHESPLYEIPGHYIVR